MSDPFWCNTCNSFQDHFGDDCPVFRESLRKGKEDRYKYWLEKVGEWAEKHKISVDSAISILTENDNNSVKQGDLYYKEFNDFVRKFQL